MSSSGRLKRREYWSRALSRNGFTGWKKHFAIQERRHWRMRFRKCAGILTEVMQDARECN